MGKGGKQNKTKQKIIIIIIKNRLPAQGGRGAEAKALRAEWLPRAAAWAEEERDAVRCTPLPGSRLPPLHTKGLASKGPFAAAGAGKAERGRCSTPRPLLPPLPPHPASALPPACPTPASYYGTSSAQRGGGGWPDLRRRREGAGAGKGGNKGLGSTKGCHLSGT